MGKIIDLIDALRRRGSASQRAAIARQDKTLDGHTVLERRRSVARHGGESMDTFAASVKPTPETVEPVSDEVLRAIEYKVAVLGPALLARFGQPSEDWTPTHLDEAFRLWLSGGDRSTYAEDDAVELFGALFGDYCRRHADMRWIRVTDAYGQSLALEGVGAPYRTFPFSVVEKRVRDGEFGFLQGVYVAIRHAARELEA